MPLLFRICMIGENLPPLYMCTQLCLTLQPHDCSPPGSSVHGIFQALPEWVAISSCRGSSWLRDQTSISSLSCIGKWILYHGTIWEALTSHKLSLKNLCDSDMLTFLSVFLKNFCTLIFFLKIFERKTIFHMGSLLYCLLAIVNKLFFI